VHGRRTVILSGSGEPLVPPCPLVDAGIIPSLVTPMLPDGTPDLESLDRLIDHVVTNGASGLLILGSTGENGMLSSAQRHDIAAHAVAAFGDRTHVMVGLPSMGLGDAVDDAVAHARAGAASLLVPAPYGCSHSPCELADYFRDIDAAVWPTPVVAHNAPSRCGDNLGPELIVELATEEVISGVEDSSGDLEAHRRIAEGTAGITGFRRYTGSELAIDAALLAGFDGAIPGLANVFVRQHVAIADHAATGDWVAAARAQDEVAGLARLYDAPRDGGSLAATAIGALKEALVQLGIIAHATLSRPLRQPGDALRAHVARVLARSPQLVA
jgi:4-hydroxy-tetrahydrodipicolinate synthase